MGGSGGAIAIDQPADQPTPAVRVMAELGADAAIIAAALAARPDYSPRQVQTLWAWCADRIARSEGRLGEGIFFHALRSGQLAPARAAPIDFTGYANDGLFRLGSDLADLEPVGTAPPTDESPHDRARALLPPWAGPRDYPLLVQLCAGLDDAAALAELARRRGRAA